MQVTPRIGAFHRVRPDLALEFPPFLSACDHGMLAPEVVHEAP
jgi:hypothetical protein